MATGNPFMDMELPGAGQTPAKAAGQLVQGARCVVRRMQQFLTQARQAVAVHGRAALATELGIGAADMLVFYNSCKAFVEANAPDEPTEDLPA